MHTRKILLFLFLLPVYCFAQVDPYHYQTQKKVTGDSGSVVSAHPLASKVGLQILKEGGNAFDAAIATQLVLAVVYPGAGNIGGGGFLVAHLNDGKNISIDYRETAPGKASRDMYLDSNGNAQLNLSQNGRLAVGIPGTVAGLFATLKYAKLPFKQLIQPAIDLAEKGFVLTADQAKSFNENREEFYKYNRSPVAFVKAGGWKAGDTLIQKQLANTLRRIRDLGPDGFYEGPTARMIVAEMQKGNGIITYDDLKHYCAKERTPIVFNYKDYTIVSMPLPSSGGILLEQMMKMIKDRNIADMKFQTPGSVQLMTEVERRAYADRASFLGDPDFVDVPVDTLVSDTYLQKRMSDYVPGKAGSSKIIKAGSIAESNETTHLCVIDKDGNAVSVTTTLNGWYGCKTVVSGAGFLLNNEMDDFSIKPGVANMYGAVGAKANAIAPYKRMLSSMTPTIVLKNDTPFIITGTPGGTTIPTSVFQTLVNIMEFNMTAEDAVNKPKFHHQWLPDEIDIEKGFSDSTKIALRAMGYKTVDWDEIGRVELIEISSKKDSKGKPITKVEAIGDKRGEDDAEGY